MNSYFLEVILFRGGMLGISDASGMYDITGTMWLVYVLFVYGRKAFSFRGFGRHSIKYSSWFYLSIWLRKSNVMTGAQWIETRFGKSRGATLRTSALLSSHS